MRKFLFLNAVFSGVAPGQTRSLYSEFDDEFDDVDAPLGQCTALYSFKGTFGSDSPSPPPETVFAHAGCVFSFLSGDSEGTISITEGDLLSIMEEDKGDGWMRVLRGSGEEGFIPSSYISRES